MEFKDPKVKVELVSPTILLNVILFVEDCHWIEPTLPFKVNAFGVFPAQIVWFEVAVPPTEIGLTVIVITLEITGGQTPFVTTAW